MKFSNFLKFGPATLITAAFIGPGTVTVCSIAGASAGFTLLWGMVFSIVATILLQEMVARITLASEISVEQNLMRIFKGRNTQRLIGMLILIILFFGNTAYQTGNLLGAELGIELILRPFDITDVLGLYLIFILLISALLLWMGNITLIKNLMLFFVALMSFSFVAAAVLSQPDVFSLLKGMFIPSIPEGQSLVLVSIIGTTVVPYNLFLYSYLVNNNYSGKSLKDIRVDLIKSVFIGGVISFSVIVVAASKEGTLIKNAADLAIFLEPTYGNLSYYLIGVGLFSAGISSAILAPLAISMIAVNVFDWKDRLQDIRARILWMIVLLLGFVFAYISYKPIEVIKIAQFLNGLLLPIMAILLLYLVNKRATMKTYKNLWYHNLVSTVVILICVILGLKSIFSVLNLI